MPGQNAIKNLNDANNNFATAGDDLDLSKLDLSVRSHTVSGDAGINLTGGGGITLATASIQLTAGSLTFLGAATQKLKTGVPTAASTGDGTAIATLNSMSGVITTATQTTAAGSQTTLTLTNSVVTAFDVVLCSVSTTGTGTPVVCEVTPASGEVVIVIQNIHASAAFNAALKVYFFIVSL